MVVPGRLTLVGGGYKLAAKMSDRQAMQEEERKKDMKGTRAMWKMANTALSVGILLSGCMTEVDGQEENSAAHESETEQAFTGNWNYSWGDTKYSFANIGTSINRTCFMSGLAGNIIPAGSTGQTGAGVRINASGNYEIFVDSDGGALNTFARCVNTSSGRTAEITWRTGDAAKQLGAVAAGRRCFLTRVTTSNAYPSEGGHGFQYNSDYVRVWQDGFNWWIGGVQSGVVWATARCINVNADYGSWQWVAGDPGTRKDQLSSNPGGVTCLLTGVGGHFNDNDWVDGAYVSYDEGINQFYMNTKDGHTGWANCVK